MTVIYFKPPAKLLNMNDRHHWRDQRKLEEEWRNATIYAAIQTLGPPSKRVQPPSYIYIDLPVRLRRRRDPHNYFPTVKPIVDGLVKAGLWPDDTPEWVSTIEPRLTFEADVIITLIPRGDA